MIKNFKKILIPFAALSLVGFLSACDTDSGSDGSSNTPPSSDASSDSQSSDSGSQTKDEITGSGTQNDPYVISSAKQFKDFAANYAALTSAPKTKEYYSLGADIDLAGEEVGPIGTKIVPFYGYFNGNQHKIKGVSLKTADKSIGAYGLFGYTSSSSIYDLYVGIDYDLSLLGAKSYYYVGGLAGYAYNTAISNVAIEGSIDLVSGQNGGSVLAVGGLTGISVAGGNSAVTISNCAVWANINCDMADSADTTNLAGGITGALNTVNSSSEMGVEFVLSSYYKGDIVAGTAVGGITATMNYYTSIVDCYAEGSSLKATDEGVSYVGGIAGQGYYETAILHNYSSFDTIDAGNSTSTYYKSFAGTSIGYAYSNGYEYSSDLYGTINYGNAASEATLTSDKVGVNGTVAEKGEAGIKAAGLSSVWSIVDGEISLGDSSLRPATANVTLDANYDGGESQNKTVSAATGVYDSKSISAIVKANFNRAHYSYAGLFYDKEGTQPYAWYAPFVGDATLYASYGDLSLILGTWDYVCASTGGTWYFDESNFYWQNRYYETFKYSYTFDGTYIFIGEGGSYEGEIFKYEDGKITGYDMTDSDYQYVGTKSSSTFVIPDYKGEAYLGEWYFTNSSHVTLNADGTASATVESSSVTQTGGFTKTTDGSFNIRVPGKLMADGLTYDATNDIFFNASYFGAREKVTTTYSTSDSSLKIYCTSSKNYAIANGTVVVTYTGTLEDGGEIVVNDVTYAVSGTTLTKKDTTPSIPADVCGTYENGSLTMVLNENGTGTWDGYEFNFTYDASTKKGTVSAFGAFGAEDNWFEVNDDGSITVHLDDEYGENPVNKTMTKKADSNIKAYVGTWIAKLGSTSNTIVLNSDGTGTYNGTAFTYTETNGTITFSVGDMDVTLTYNSATGTMTGQFEQDYETISYTSITKQDDAPTVVAGYVGTWIAKRSSYTYTIVINSDGTGTYNGTEFTYTETNGTITFSVGDTEVTLKYDSSTGEMTGGFNYDYEDYTFDSITKQA